MSSASSELTKHSQFIRAGAGAGKTTQLISSFLNFVKDFHRLNERFPRVVITTFTRKATQEVKERLLVSALKDNEKTIFEYINRKSFVHISTIHGLLSLYLAQHADLLSLPQEIKIVDGAQYLRTLKKNIHYLMKQQTDYIHLLESYPFYQLIDLAKAGLDLKAQHSQLDYVKINVLEELTNVKLKLIVDKINEMFVLVPSIPDKWSAYFSYWQQVLALILNGQEKELLLHLENTVRKPVWSAAKPAFDERAYEIIEELRQIDIFTVQDTKDYQREHEKLNSLFFNFIQELYVLDFEHKQSTGELTIADLENMAWQLTQLYPRSAEEFSDSWDYFMIDEYQDTSPLQVNLLNQLVREKPCFIVGDPQQSIYLFRGARSEVFVSKESELKEKNITTRILDRNYRSEPSLMQFMNDFFTNFSNQFSPMQVRDPNPDRKIQTDAYYIKAHDENLAVLKQIQFLITQGVSPKDICVLSKSNSKLILLAQAAQDYQIPVQLQAASGFEEKREILDLIHFLKFLVNPHDNENLVGLLRSPWLYADDKKIFDICQSSEAKSFSIWYAILKNHAELKESLLYYLKFFEAAGASLTLKEMVQQTGFMVFSNLLDKTGKREANTWKFLTSLTQAEKELGFSLGLFLEDRFQSLQSDLGSSAGEAQPVIQPDCVSLMTVHASKGLEFKNVIVIGFTDKPKTTNQINLAFDPEADQFSLAVFDQFESSLKPSVWSQRIRKELNRRELEENERVLYVAMTRAQESISLIARMVPEGERQTIVKEAWYKKILWPAEGDGTDSNLFAYKSISLDDEMTALKLVPPKMMTARPKLVAETNRVTGPQSVTNTISSRDNNEAKELSKTDYSKLTSSLKKAQKGTELHRIFESMKYRPYEFLESTMAANELELVNYLLNQSELDLKSILAYGHNEWGFGIKIKNGILQGQIDAWAELPTEIHILDYKTGSSEYHQKAFEQLSLYTLALLKMNQISRNKQIIHSVVYPTERKIIKKTFKNASAFELEANSKLRELFD